MSEILIAREAAARSAAANLLHKLDGATPDDLALSKIARDETVAFLKWLEAGRHLNDNFLRHAV